MADRLKALAKRWVSEVALRAASASQERLLLYHRVEARPRSSDPWSLARTDFEAQLAEIGRLGYDVVDLMQLVGPVPPRAGRRVAIAFDDGYASTLENALPALRRAGYVATFFLVPGAMGATSTWEAPLGLAASEVMSWSDARRLADSDMAIGSHSFSHADLSRATDAEMRREIRLARDLVVERLGIQVNAFSVPFGRDDARLDRELRASGHRVKVTNELARRIRTDDFAVEPCTAIINGDDLREFRKKLSGAYDWLRTYRRMRRRVARRPREG